MRKTTMGRVRRGRRNAQRTGYLVTWDVNSADHATASRVHRFVYGGQSLKGDRIYRYPGFVERPGVRYLGQSVLFVPPSLLADIDLFLSRWGVDHEATPATIG